MKPYIKTKLLVFALASLARGGKCGSFFAREASAKVPFNAYFGFVYGFKTIFTHSSIN
ncbi:MAG: hypothetical protein U5L45_18675 [Saprospiraceae bacterium]|nr:hypothetical protein [Saprospiraceae bacterium]